MKLPDPSLVASILRRVGQEIIAPRFQGLEATEIREKKPGDLVTVVDHAAEAALESALSALLPEARFIGEESIARDPERLAWLSEPGLVWLADPLDGTGNFVAGRPHFGTLLALIADGVTVGGWLYHVPQERTAWAVQGQGCQVDGRRARIAAAPALSQMAGFLDHKLSEGLSRSQLKRRAEANLGTVWHHGCSLREYLAIIDGTAQFKTARMTLPWDHAAGILMVEEAGGICRRLDHSPYRLGELRPGLLVAPDAQSWQRLHHLFTEPEEDRL